MLTMINLGRCGVLLIQVETGWYTNINIENRLCDMCNKNKVTDELHFILGCTNYREERKNFLGNISIK